MSLWLLTMVVLGRLKEWANNAHSFLFVKGGNNDGPTKQKFF